MVASLIIWLGLVLAVAATAARAGEAPWSSGDYVDSYFRHHNGHVPLPHLRDEVQKALFNHLIDAANTARIKASTAAADEKLQHRRGP